MPKSEEIIVEREERDAKFGFLEKKDKEFALFFQALS
jgi:hypothetical protein